MLYSKKLAALALLICTSNFPAFYHSTIHAAELNASASAQSSIIEASTDLTAWSSLTRLSAAGEPLVIEDPAASSLPMRFYRLRQTGSQRVSAPNAMDSVSVRVATSAEVKAFTIFSVNAVGFVNVTIAAGQWALLANPLNHQHSGSYYPSNDLNSVLSDAYIGTKVYAFDPGSGSFSAYTKRSTNAWSGTAAETVRLDPGKGFFLQNPADKALQITFIGEVPQGHQILPIQAGANLIGSIFPLEGSVETNLHLPAQDGDRVYLLPASAGGYQLFQRRTIGWLPNQPAVRVAEGFWFFSTTPRSWEWTFYVNQ
jgi:hypothetical protein